MSFSRAERRAYNFIAKYIGDNDGVSPSHIEIANYLGCASSNVTRLVRQLEAKRHIVIEGSGHRSIRLATDQRMNVYVCKGSIHALVIAPTMPDAWRMLVETVDEDERDDLNRMSLEKVDTGGAKVLMM